MLERRVPGFCVAGARPFGLRVPALLVFLLACAPEAPKGEPTQADEAERIGPAADGEHSPNPHATGALLYRYIEGVLVQGIVVRSLNKGVSTHALLPILMRAVSV